MKIKTIVAVLFLYCVSPLSAGAQENLPTDGPGAHARARALAHITARMQESNSPGLQEVRQRMIERGGFPEDFNPQTARFKDGRPFDLPGTANARGRQSGAPDAKAD